jgi:methyl-accepting chemotaxis protein
MLSVKTKITVSLIAIILVMVGLVVAIMVINRNLIKKYQDINSNIVYEQDLKNSIWLTIEFCYNDFKTGDFTSYEKELSRVKDLENILDVKTRSNKDTYAAYLGVKNSLNIVVSEVSSAITEWKASGGKTGTASFLENVGTKFEFVKQNTTDLILVETQNIANISQEIQRTQTNLDIVTGIIAILVIISSVIYSLYFAKKITDPITTLSSTAKKIADGDFNINVEAGLLNIKDETGSLATSFQNMVISLRLKIQQLVESERSAKKVGEEFARVNRLMIGRELKMIELKKEIERLKSRTTKV